MHIRRATTADLEGIVAINTWAIENTVANFAIEPESLESWVAKFEQTQEMFPWFVATEGEQIVGFSKASPWKGRCAYRYSVEVTVYVHPDHHRKGIGRALYRPLLDTLEAQGYRSAYGGIALPNPASVGLHESFGMKRVALFEGIGFKFGGWHDVGYWQAKLQNDPGVEPVDIKPVAEVLRAT